jgi:hypothetical protein
MWPAFGNMLSPWQWAALLAVPPLIVLLYFLKLRRQPIEVPSTYLWRRSIEDLHVNSIWQRLRKNLLLLLQLLLVLLAIFALLRPNWHGKELLGHRFIFLVDNSASMGATDVSPTRLDEAKRRVAELVDQMESGDVAMLVSFSDSAHVEQPFTDNRRLLKQKLQDIRQTNRTTQLAEALRVSAGLANPGRSAFEIRDERVADAQPATMYILSDGKFPDVTGFSVGALTPVFVPIGKPEAKNVAITAFSTQRSEDADRKLQAFARLENIGAADVSVEGSLYLNGELLDASQTSLKAGGNGGMVFELGGVEEGVLRLEIKTNDALAVDNQAWVAINPPKRNKVLVVTPGNESLEVALNTESLKQVVDLELATPEILKTEGYKKKAAAAEYAFVLYDRCVPEQMPQANTLFIGNVPPLPGWTMGERAPAPGIIDVSSNHPLTQLLELSNVKFVEGRAVMGPPGTNKLIDSDIGPLLAIAPREGFEDAALGVEIIGISAEGEAFVNTDWPLRLSFPLFVLNTVQYFTVGSESQGTGNVQPGHTVALRSPSNAEKIKVTSPGGAATELTRGRFNTFSFVQTDELGTYTVAENGKTTGRFAVNLFDSAESNIPPRPEKSIQLGSTKVEGQTAWEGVRREAWKPLLAMALFVLLFEWYIYNRRVYL